MKRVHRVQDNTTDAHTVDIVPDEIAALSCIVMAQINDGTLDIQHNGIGEPGFNFMYNIAAAQVGAVLGIPFAFNIYPVTLRFNFGAATNRRVHLDFFDSPITPFGFQCPLFGTTNVLATANAEAFAGRQFRGFREIKILVSGPQAGTYSLGLGYGTNTTTLIYEISTSTVVPTVQAMDWIPNPNAVQMQIFNTSGSAADFQWQVWGKI